MSLDVAANGATLLGRNNIDPARWKRYRGGTAGQSGSMRAAAERSRASAPISAETSCGRCGSANASCFCPITKASATSTRRAPTDRRATPDRRARVLRALPVHRRQAHRLRVRRRDRVARSRQRRAVRVAIETPSAAPQTARRFVDAGDLLETYAPSPDGKALALVSRGHAYTMPLWEAAVSELGARQRGRRRAIVWLHDGTRVAYVERQRGLRAHRDRAGRPERAAELRDDRRRRPHHRTRRLAVRRPARVCQPPPRTVRTRSAAARRASSTPAKPGAASISRSRPTAGGSPTCGRRSRARLIIRIADCESGTVVDATEALRDDRAPAWDPEGKYLYFISARDFNPIYDALQFDLSFPHAMRPYVVTLRSDVPNPFVPVPAPLHQAKTMTTRTTKTRTTATTRPRRHRRRS